MRMGMSDIDVLLNVQPFIIRIAGHLGIVWFPDVDCQQVKGYFTFRLPGTRLAIREYGYVA